MTTNELLYNSYTNHVTFVLMCVFLTLIYVSRQAYKNVIKDEFIKLKRFFEYLEVVFIALAIFTTTLFLITLISNLTEINLFNFKIK